MRVCVYAGILTLAAVVCLAGESRAEECPKEVAAAAERLRLAVVADAPPELVSQVAAKHASATELARLLAPHPELVEPIVDAALKFGTTLARRDGPKAVVA